jgi:CBS domain-containing protein
MHQSGVGCVVVERDRRPIAILTDRDLALDALCEDLDVGVALVQDVMGHAPITIFEGEPLHAAVQKIRAERVRRLPVVDASGLLVGLLSADDLLLHAAARLSRLCNVIDTQIAAHPEEARHARD